MTVTALQIFFSIRQFTLGTFSISAFSSFVFALLVVSGLLGKFLCDWESVLVSRAFFGGF